MDEGPTPADWLPLQRVTRTIVVVDVVESVLLMQVHEMDVITRWRSFVHEVRENILPRYQGRMVKSLGDGLLLEFESALCGVKAALDIQQCIKAQNQGHASNTELRLRAGVHETQVVIDEFDVYGAGVNLAARLATLAGPGEVILSPEVRDALVPGLDVEVVDLGDCYLKHINEPQRAFRAGPISKQSLIWANTAAGASDRVIIAVIPFIANAPTDPQQLLGEVLADDLIAQLSQLQQLHVISRLSTTVFRNRDLDLNTLSTALGCHYVVHGSCVVGTDRFRLRAQLVDCLTSEVIWAGALDGTVTDALSQTSPVIDQLTAHLCHALLDAEVHRAVTSPLPTLQSYTILLGAIASMHRLSPREFERSRDMLSYLIERHPRATGPRAWLGKWYVMRVAQGWSNNPATDAQAARSIVAQALDLNPDQGLALAIDGLICAYINKDLATASQRYDAALLANPSESLAWLFRSALHSYRNEGVMAVECAMRAQKLSPLDPMKYYYDNFTSTAKLSADDYVGAIEYGTRSLKANRTHGPTLRILAIAQVLAGQVEDARKTVLDMKLMEPGFSVSRFMDRFPGKGTPRALKYADALRIAGLPS